MNTYLITGATGVVGSEISQTLLVRKNAQLRLLIRADSDAEVQKRLSSLIDYWGVGDARADGKVVALRGDVALPQLGLPAGEYARLATECTHIVHSAAAVRMNLPIDEARRSAVGGVKHVLELAQASRRNGQFVKAEFLSTVGVGGRLEDLLPERWITEPRAFHNTYEQAKAEAEAIIAGALSEGLNGTVHRPSMVVGNSRTGRIRNFQIFYHLVELLSGRMTFGLLPPLGEKRLDIVPVDHVAAAVAWSSSTMSTAGRVLHLCSGPDRSLPIEELRHVVRERFAAAGIALPRAIRVPIGALKAVARTAAPLLPVVARRTLRTLPIFLDYLAEDQSFANVDTTALLEAAKIRLPRTREFLVRVLDSYLARNALRS